MSSTLRHCCHGIAGETGAPRPTLVNSAGGGVAREHDVNMAIDSAASAAPPTLKEFFFDIGRP